MGEWVTTLTSSPQGQFLIGVAALVFGSRAILSEERLKGKLWGLGWPVRWLRKKQEEAAEREVSELKRLREETNLQHQYIVWITTILRTVQIWAADNGYKLPPPPPMSYNDWRKEKDEDRGE